MKKPTKGLAGCRASVRGVLRGGRGAATWRFGQVMGKLPDYWRFSIDAAAPTLWGKRSDLSERNYQRFVYASWTGGAAVEGRSPSYSQENKYLENWRRRGYYRYQEKSPDTSRSFQCGKVKPKFQITRRTLQLSVKNDSEDGRFSYFICKTGAISANSKKSRGLRI